MGTTLSRLLWVGRSLSWSSLAVMVAGCSSCGKDGSQDQKDETFSFEVAPGMMEEPWNWEPVEVRGFSVPAGCRLMSVPHRYVRDTRNLFFFAADGDPGTLAVATGTGQPGHVTSTRGLVSLGIEKPGVVRDIPWLHLDDPPVMAASLQGWIALLTEQDAFSPEVRAWLWREGGRLDLLARGDGLSVVDARCDGSLCAVLTTRAVEVASPGATIWVGEPKAHGSWSRWDVMAGEIGEGAKPMGLAGWVGETRSALIAFAGPRYVEFVRVGSEGVVREGKVERGVVVLDSIELGKAKVVIMTRGEPDARGCVHSGAKVEVAVVGGESTFLPVSVPPDSAYVRRLRGGGFLTWAAPVNCRLPERKVVTGVLLGSDGIPVSSAMALGNADGHAMTTGDDEVHVWLSDPRAVTWLRATCP